MCSEGRSILTKAGRTGQAHELFSSPREGRAERASTVLGRNKQKKGVGKGWKRKRRGKIWVRQKGIMREESDYRGVIISLYGDTCPLKIRPSPTIVFTSVNNQLPDGNFLITVSENKMSTDFCSKAIISQNYCAQSICHFQSVCNFTLNWKFIETCLFLLSSYEQRVAGKNEYLG